MTAQEWLSGVNRGEKGREKPQVNVVGKWSAQWPQVAERGLACIFILLCPRKTVSPQWLGWSHMSLGKRGDTSGEACPVWLRKLPQLKGHFPVEISLNSGLYRVTG